jgi:APA family basic amino acid/polyamine antiporter
MLDSAGAALEPGSVELAKACAANVAATGTDAVVCSKEALAWTLREIGWPQIGNLIGLAAGLALPSVILMMMFGQTRIFFVMSRDGLLPAAFSKIHPRYNTPHIITVLTGIFVALFAAFFPVGQLANISNSGTLFAFAAVSIAVIALRRTDPGRHRPFRTPAIMLTAPVAIAGCLYLFYSLDIKSQILFAIWAIIGLVVYFTYSRSRSHVGRGLSEVHEMDSDAPPTSVPPIS